MILLRTVGTPCVFYSDYYGNPVKNRPLVPNLGKMIKIRYSYAYGEENDYFDDPHIIGWVRRGDAEHPDSGTAVLLSNADGGQKRMFMGTEFSGEAFCDAIGNCQEKVVIDDEGWGEFRTEGGNVAVWVREKAFEDLIINE